MKVRAASLVAALMVSCPVSVLNASSDIGPYIAEFCRQKGASMELAMHYYRDYNGDRRRVRDAIFTFWRKNKIDYRLQSMFIGDIDGFLDELDQAMKENPKDTFNMLRYAPSFEAIGNRVEQDCIVEAGRRR